VGSFSDDKPQKLPKNWVKKNKRGGGQVGGEISEPKGKHVYFLDKGWRTEK